MEFSRVDFVQNVTQIVEQDDDEGDFFCADIVDRRLNPSGKVWFSPNGSDLITTEPRHNDCIITAWDSDLRGVVWQRLLEGTNSLTTLYCAHNKSGNILVWPTHNNTAVVLRADNGGEPLVTFGDPDRLGGGVFTCYSFSDCGARIALGFDSGSIVICSLMPSPFSVIQTIDGRDLHVCTVNFIHEDKMLISSYVDGSLELRHRDRETDLYLIIRTFSTSFFHCFHSLECDLLVGFPLALFPSNGAGKDKVVFTSPSTGEHVATIGYETFEDASGIRTGGPSPAPGYCKRSAQFSTLTSLLPQPVGGDILLVRTEREPGTCIIWLINILTGKVMQRIFPTGWVSSASVNADGSKLCFVIDGSSGGSAEVFVLNRHRWTHKKSIGIIPFYCGTIRTSSFSLSTDLLIVASSRGQVVVTFVPFYP